MAHRLAQVSDALQERYAIERELGRGGMATVYLARDLRHGRRVALKLLDAELAAAVGPERFKLEIRLAGRLSHAHILPVFDSGEAAGRLWYAMPYVEGESLRQRLQREPQLPVAEMVRIAGQVAGALDHAHQRGVIHRDIKPENILLAGDQALVADFGIARALDAAGGERLTETGLALGTPAYMSPEQAAPGGRLDQRSDIYALGCVAYEMLAGAPPFNGPTAQAILARHAVDPVPPLRTVRPTVSEPVAYAIMRALAKVPSDRFASAGEFAEALLRQSIPALATAQPVFFRRAIALTLVAMAAAVGIGAARLLGTRSAPVLPSASTIAVLPFSAPSGDTALARLGRDLAVTLGASLDGVGGIRALDRLSVAAAVPDARGLTIAQAARLTRRLGARSMTYGSVVRDGGAVRLDFSLFEVDTVAPLAQGIIVTGHSDSLSALTDSASWAILRRVWQRGDPPSPSLAAVTTRSVPALRAFLDGERLVDLDKWDDAELAYRGAIAADSTFWLAQFRYQQTLSWRHQDVDPALVSRLHRQRQDFAEPDRLILDSWSEPHRNTPLRQVALYREATRRFPDYWPGWLALGDWLFHLGPMLGHGWREAQAALHRVVALNPRHQPAWRHLYGNSVGKDTTESSRALARILELTPLDPSDGVSRGQAQELRVMRLGQAMARYGTALAPGTETLWDSVAMHVVSRGAASFPAAWGFLWWGFPAGEIELGRRVIRFGARPDLAADHLRGVAWGWAERGAWDSALVAMREAVRTEPDPMSRTGPVALDEFELAALGVWLGALNPLEAEARRPAVVSMITMVQDSSRRVELMGTLAWLDGLVAFAHGDPEALERAKREGSTSGHPQSTLIDRSLGAFRRALAGNRVAAGRELAALEWQCGDQWDCRPYVPNIAVQHIAAAQWLLEAGDTAQAARLLVWHEAAQGGWDWAFTFAATPLAHLMLARITGAQGDSSSAQAHYEQFLRRYDSPLPSQRHLVAEARTALARLVGTGDRPSP